MKKRQLALMVFAITALFGCGSNDKTGGYYSDDGPPSDEMVAKAIEPTPISGEPLSKTGNNPYKVFGKNYYPRNSIEAGYSETGVASWYGTKFHGKRTSSGERYDMMAFTAAHKTLPLPTYVRVTSLENNRSVIVRVNDRGPFLKGRIIDLSYVAAKKIGIAAKGTGQVRIEVIKSLDDGISAPLQGRALAEATPIEVYDEPLEVVPFNEKVSSVGAVSAINVAGSQDATITDDSILTAEGPIFEAGSDAVILERHTVQLDDNNDDLGAKNMSNDDDIILPSLPQSVTGENSSLQTGPIVDINSIIKKSDYFIQVGAFRNKENAYKLRQTYLEKGHSSRILTTGDVYRVQVGPFTSIEEAEMTMSLLRSSGAQDATLIKPNE